MSVSKCSVGLCLQIFDDGDFEGLPDLLTIDPVSLDLPVTEVKSVF